MSQQNILKQLENLMTMTVSRLCEAVREGDIDSVRKMCEFGADVNALSRDDGISPLFIAAEMGHVEVVRLLCGKGANKEVAVSDGATPLFVSCLEGHVHVVRLLCELGSNVHAPTTCGTTPLLVAVQGGNIEVLKILCEYGASVNVERADGVTPIIMAIFGGRTDIVKLLTEYGADLSTPMSEADNATPVSLAAQQGYVDIIRVLHSLGAAMNTPRTSGASPLFIASQQGNVEVIRILCELGADVNMLRKDGASPIYIAVQQGFVDAACELANLGADIHDCFTNQADFAFDATCLREMVDSLCARAGLIASPVGECTHDYSDLTLKMFSVTKLLFNIAAGNRVDSSSGDLSLALLETDIAVCVNEVMMTKSAVDALCNSTYVLRRNVSQIAWKLCLSSPAREGSSDVIFQAKSRRYVEMACFLLNPVAINDVLSLRLTCHSNNARSRFPVYSTPYFELEANIIEEWLGSPLSYMVSTGTLMTVLSLHRV